KQYHLAAKAVHEAYGGLEAFQRAMKMAALVIILACSVGCRGVERLIGGSTQDEGTPYIPPHGPLAEQNVVPVYDQATATPAQKEDWTRRVIGDPASANFQTYIAQPWLINNLNGHHNMMLNPPVGMNSILVDTWKALARQQYVDNSKLEHP